jgi:tetratricopeptide (TPR) repeat protein
MSNQETSHIIPQQALFQSIADNLDDGNTRFAFLLGAGASVSSGIPSGEELANKWLKELKKFNPEKHSTLQEFINDSSTPSPAHHYSKIFEERFQHNPRDGYNEIEKIITHNSIEPSVGYILLANFLLETENNIVITTNFDRLPETALLTVFNQHSKVIYHENMLPILALDNKKPTIVKIHNDVFFQPRNNEEHTAKLSDAWKKKIDEILTNYHLIIMGYGGNDREGLMQHLLDYQEPEKLYWCFRNEQKIPKKVLERKVLEKKFKLVQIDEKGGFDSFMLNLNQKMPEGKISKLEAILESIEKTTKEKIHKINNKVDELSKNTPSSEGLSLFTANTWVDFQRRINQESDSNKQDELYQQGLEQFKSSHELMGNYAIFLDEVRKDYKQAEKYYQKALELEPEDGGYHGNYAIFLKNIRKDYEQAEIYYQKALELAPEHAYHNGNYAFFLHFIRQDYEQAEIHYKKSLELEPENAGNNGNYAGFLLARGRTKQGLDYLNKAEKICTRDDLKLELLFYRLAHSPETYAENKVKIEQLINNGVRSVGWNFDENIEQAKKEGNKHLDELTQLAKIITTDK